MRIKSFFHIPPQTPAFLFIFAREMHIRHKRNWAARLLLAVFIPMVLLSVTHRHDFQPTGTSNCDECVKHVPHAGHLLPHVNHVSDCVLCQFLQISSIVVSAAISLFVCQKVQHYLQPENRCREVCVAHPSTRAPPIVA